MKNPFPVLLAAGAALFVIGAAVAAEPDGGTVKRTVTVGDLSRTYYLHVPATLPKDKAAALVLAFHGGGGAPLQVERVCRFSDLADREGFLVAYPEGIGKSWNDGRGGETTQAQRENVNDLAFVAALLDDAEKSYRIDEKRVFATGISNGGIFSQYLAANLSSRIAAIAPVAGGLPEPSGPGFKPEKPVSVLILQGVADPLVPYNGGDVTVFRKTYGRILDTDETVKKWVEHDGCNREAVAEDVPDTDPGDGCRVKKFTYAQGRDGTEVVLYRIEGGGHTWPDGRSALPEMLVGKTCRDFNGTTVIWAFFKAHPKP